jgi:4-hydroxy-3-polyprenylbenzoate decarboxylase
MGQTTNNDKQRLTGRPTSPISRRDFLATGVGLTASVDSLLAASHDAQPAAAGEPRVATGPFDTFREYVAALEAHGQLLRFNKVDQDAYEGTAIMYRLVDKYGIWGAPTILFEQVKINGEWRQGPLIGNDQGPWATEAIAFGLTPVPHDGWATYRQAKAYFTDILRKSGGSYPQIAPLEVTPDKAFCKEVVLRGDDIDLTRFAFIQVNPADQGRYINTGSVFTADPEMGVNFGTYRCHLRGPRKIGVNPEPNQTGWKMLMRAKERGEKIARVSIALSNDPVVWMISGSRVGNRRGDAPVDELAIAGGLRGRPLEVVRSETNDLLVPAHAEMVIEGEIPLDDFEPEGPYGEMYGYMGLYKEENFWMNVTAVTHRRNPWLMNSFTGVNRGTLKAAGDALAVMSLQRMIPGLVDYHTTNDATGISFVSIDKTRPGQGLEVGKQIAERISIAKVLLVVDSDLDVVKRTDMLLALGSRWQPHPATHIYEELRGMPLDPSTPNRPMSSKIVIDATRQWPEEGGPAVYADLNRTLLVKGSPEVFDRVDARWGEVMNNWRCRDA